MEALRPPLVWRDVEFADGTGLVCHNRDLFFGRQPAYVVSRPFGDVQLLSRKTARSPIEDPEKPLTKTYVLDV